jgi:hypothetical protein
MLDKERLNFLNVMASTMLLALIYYVALKTVVEQFYAVVPNLAIYSVPAVIVSGLCFYLVGVWNPSRRRRPCGLNDSLIHTVDSRIHSTRIER